MITPDSGVKMSPLDCRDRGTGIFVSSLYRHIYRIVQPLVGQASWCQMLQKMTQGVHWGCILLHVNELLPSCLALNQIFWIHWRHKVFLSNHFLNSDIFCLYRELKNKKFLNYLLNSELFLSFFANDDHDLFKHCVKYEKFFKPAKLFYKNAQDMNFCKLLNSAYAKIGVSSSDLLRWWRRLAAHTPRVVDIYISCRQMVASSRKCMN